MHLTNFKRLITAIVLLSFVWGSGCATLFGIQETAPSPREPTEAYIIELEEESAESYVTVPLEKGDAAPEDGVWFDKESALRLLEMKARYDGLRAEVGVQNQIAIMRAKQIDVIYEGYDLQKQANEELLKKIERDKRWAKWEKWLSVFVTIGAMAASKYVWD
jgi:hypothetical protein